MSKNDDTRSPLRARSDLVDILSCNPENAELIATLIESELYGIKTGESAELSEKITKAAENSSIDKDAIDNVLFWLSSSSLDARQLILIKTIEELLNHEECRPTVLNALAKISSEENVNLVMDWVDKGVLTLNQAIYVLLFPDSSAALK